MKRPFDTKNILGFIRTKKFYLPLCLAVAVLLVWMRIDLWRRWKIAAILAASFLACCSQHSVGAPIGSWSADNGTKLVIRTNGTFSMTIPPPDLKTNVHYIAEFSGTYTIVDSTHIKFEYLVWEGRFKAVSTNRFSVSGYEMSFQVAGSQTITKYHRAKD